MMDYNKLNKDIIGDYLLGKVASLTNEVLETHETMNEIQDILLYTLDLINDLGNSCKDSEISEELYCIYWNAMDRLDEINGTEYTDLEV